jgi:ubiquinone/menaquinone biosynthesis C-methylase UbiE
MKFMNSTNKINFDARSPVGLLNSEMDGLTREILEQEVKDGESWLDLGCGMKPFLSSFSRAHYVGIDVESSGADESMKSPDLYFNGNHVPFSKNFFDGILCTQVLEHAKDSDSLIRECNRVLKTGGKAIVSVPFLVREHEQPYDFRRFTSFGLVELLEKNGFKVSKLIKVLSPIETLATLFVTYLTNTYGSKSKWLYRLIAYTIVAPSLILARLVSMNTKTDRDIYCVLIVVAAKEVDLVQPK